MEDFWLMLQKYFWVQNPKKIDLFWILGFKFFWGPKSKIRHNKHCGIHINIDSERYIQIHENVGCVGFLGKMGFWDSFVFLCRLLWSIWVQLTSNLICILPLNIKVNDRQNKLEVNISKNVAKMAYFRPKIGNFDLTIFLVQSLAWGALGLWTQNHPQIVGKCPGHGPQLIPQIWP